jgi:GT2 family glycosyltransferase
MNNNKIGIIILNYNSKEYTLNCVDSINKKSAKKNYHIYIVDNCSPDKSGIDLKDHYQNISNITVLLNTTNFGYSHGNNIGIKYAINDGCEYFFIVNSDIEYTNNAHEILEDYMEKNPNIGIVAPMVKTPYNKVQPGAIKSPRTFTNKIIASTFLRKLFPKWANKVSESKMDQYDTNNPFKCYEVSGCAWMIRKSTIDVIGLLDENTFLYCEEVIYAHKAHAINIQTWVNPNAEVIHFGVDGERYQSAFSYICYVNSENYYLAFYSRWNWIKLSILLMLRDIKFMLFIFRYRDYRNNIMLYFRMRKKTIGFPFGRKWVRLKEQLSK